VVAVNTTNAAFSYHHRGLLSKRNASREKNDEILSFSVAFDFILVVSRLWS